MPVPPCPECKAGKHGNCDGRTWDPDKDCETTCPCRDIWHDQAEEATMRRLTGWRS